MGNQQNSDNKAANQANTAAKNVANRETSQVRNELQSEIRQRMGWLSRLKSMLGMH